MDSGTSVKVAVRIRPLSSEESNDDGTLCINTVPGVPQIIAGTDAFFTFDHVFGVDSTQSSIYDDCVIDLINAAFEGFNATILAYGQTGSGKTWTMGSGSSTDMRSGSESFGIIPRVIQSLFEVMHQREQDDPNSTYKFQVQFLEIYGEEIRDLLDHTKTSKVTIRETTAGEVFVSGAREEVVGSAAQMMKALEDGSRYRTTASTMMNLTSSRSHAIFTVYLENTIHRSSVVNIGASSIDETGIDDIKTVHEKLDDDYETSLIVENNDVTVTHSKEVRRCKFHFVDLAGSERAKRTGAQGHQMKEGIDINKGLLALGNVISALGDEQKKGKVHVPYRVSKLTRMLQDSLGGNSKTLMICCVSPSASNFYESVNALRYANRARNIKNKPVVNRDPTLVVIDELKELIQVLATELVAVRRSGLILTPASALPLHELELLLLNGNVHRTKLLQLSNASQPPQRGNFRGEGKNFTPFENCNPASVIGNGSSKGSNETHNKIKTSEAMNGSRTASGKNDIAFTKRESFKEITKLKNRADESDFAVKRLTEQLRRTKMQASELSERVILIQSERDFFKMKLFESSPHEMQSLASPSKIKETAEESTPEISMMDEKEKVIGFAAEYLREIDALKRQLAMQQQQITSSDGALQLYDVKDALLENELTFNVARVIAQTEKHLLQEAKRLKKIGVNVVTGGGLSDSSDDDRELNIIEFSTESHHNSPSGGPTPIAESQIEEDVQAYQRRQKLMIEEVSELEESIELKEQLLGQLKRSQYQYGVMKAFYEQKLSALNDEMGEKQVEREDLERELHDLENSTTKHEEDALRHQKEQEKRLRVQLQKKDDELRLLKKRQEELSGLSRVQSRYMTQVARLESDIDIMRKQKVDLSKSLQQEKKKHFTLLNEKARENEKLKRDLMMSAGEAKRLGKDKLRAEERTKEAMKDTAAMRKKVNTAESSSAKAQMARRVMGGAGKSSTARILSEDELRVKKWLDRRIASINAREEATDLLRKQCEQQISLLNRKEALKLERATMEKTMRDVIIGNSSGDESGKPLSKEEDEALQEIEDRLDCVEGQLKLRDRNIDEIEKKLAGGKEISGQDSTVEALKRTSAVSLPAAHELIRLLFDMLVTTKSSSKQRKNLLSRSESREKQLRYDLDDASVRLNVLIRAHDMELTRCSNEYEEKMLGLFTYSSIGKIVIAESGISEDSVSPLSASPIRQSDSPASSIGRYRSSAEASYKMLLSVATEQSNLLRSRLERESLRTTDLQSRLSEVDHTCSNLERVLEEKDVHIRFLEDERALFRDMADSLRAGISALGSAAGNTILKQIKDRINISANLHDSDEDDETESMLGEFDNLEEVILRTGNVNEEIIQTSAATGKVSPTSTGTLGASRGVVYDRLTNPNNFTGAMKNVFGQDLAKRRQKVQQIKSGQPIKGSAGFVFLTSRANHNKEHITAYLEGNSIISPHSSTESLHLSPFDGSPHTPPAPPFKIPVTAVSRFKPVHVLNNENNLSRGIRSRSVNTSPPTRSSRVPVAQRVKMTIAPEEETVGEPELKILTPKKKKEVPPSIPPVSAKSVVGLQLNSLEVMEGQVQEKQRNLVQVTQDHERMGEEIHALACEQDNPSDPHSPSALLSKKLWENIEKEEAREVTDRNDPRERRISMDSVYSAVVQEEYEELSENFGSEAIKKEPENGEAFNLEEDDRSNGSSYYSLNSLGGGETHKTMTTVEERHRMKMKNRLHSATSNSLKEKVATSKK